MAGIENLDRAKKELFDREPDPGPAMPERDLHVGEVATPSLREGRQFPVRVAGGGAFDRAGGGGAARPFCRAGLGRAVLLVARAARECTSVNIDQALEGLSKRGTPEAAMHVLREVREISVGAPPDRISAPVADQILYSFDCMGFEVVLAALWNGTRLSARNYPDIIRTDANVKPNFSRGATPVRKN